MAPLNTASARVVDPILSTVALGYRPRNLVGRLLFPSIPVTASGGKIIEYGREAFRLYNTNRAPGGKSRRLDIGYEGKPYALATHGLEGKVPFEWMRDAATVPGIDLGTRAINTVMQVNSNILEYEQAAIARNAANYDDDHKKTLAGTALWNAETGRPFVDIDDAKEAVRASTGEDPNVLVLSAKAWKAAKNNPSVKENFKLLNGSVTLEMFKGAVEIDNVVVAKAVYSSGFDDAFTDTWGLDAILAYAPQQPSGQEEPSYGFTYTMTGHPMVEEAYQDRSEKSWIYPTAYERAPVLSGMIAGFLIQDAGKAAD